MKDMKYYIHKEKEIYTNILKNRKQLLAKILDKNIKFNEVVIYATGSSSNAAFAARDYMAKCLQVPVHVEEPSLAANYMMYLRKDTLYLAISQGGHSYSILEMINNVQENGNTIYALTSDEYSPIAKNSDNLILMGMKIEEMPYVTAGYSATILLLDLLALELGVKNGKVTNTQYQEYLKQFELIITNMSSIIEKSQKWIAKNKTIFNKAKRMIFIGYGATYGVAREGETKITETVHITALGKELEEYMHGPYLGLHDSDCIIFIEPQGKLIDRANKLKEFLDMHVKNVMTIYAKASDTDKLTDLDLNVENNEELLASLYLTIPIHLLAFELSKLKNIDLFNSTYPEFDKITGSKI